MFLGVDQTGAVDGRGRAKALPSCLLIENEVRFFSLTSFDSIALEKRVPKEALTKLLICIDCVLGLPDEMNVSWRQALDLTKQYEGYGRSVAQEYFRSLGNGSILRRGVEVLCKANSVFQEQPFQKNIQTGTYRFWKDMAKDPDWFSAPLVAGERNEGRVPVLEGYPTLLWKVLFKVNARSPAKLPELLKEHFPKLRWTDESQELVLKDPNYGDALVLALAASKFGAEAFKRVPSKEGWILCGDQI